MVTARRRECEYEVTRRAQLRRQRGEPTQIRLEMFERVLVAHADHESRAARADDPQRAAWVEVIGGERQRVEYRQAFAIIQLAAHRRGALADGNAAILLNTAHFDVDNARFRLLSHVTRRTVPPREHVVRCHRRVADETDFSPGREEAGTHPVLTVVRRENESRIGVIELACNREHLCFREAIRVEHNTGRVTGEAITCEGVDLVDLDLSCHGVDSKPFAWRWRGANIAIHKPWGGPTGPETSVYRRTR